MRVSPFSWTHNLWHTVEMAKSKANKKVEPQNSVTLVGTSVRAVAWSAVRAGERPLCLDLFNDTDLLGLPGVIAKRMGNWPPEELDELVPEGIPWAYTGGLENYPRLVGMLAKQAPLHGNSGETLLNARLPWRWCEKLQAAGACVPEWAFAPPAGAADGWMHKPLRSAGGKGVRAWPEGGKALPWRWFAQRKVEGLSASAVFAVSTGEFELLGVTEQWVGKEWLGSKGYAYCGSIGPIEFSEDLRGQLELIGKGLQSMELRGLVGVDLVIEGDKAWVIEINPRWPASVELLERAGGYSAWEWHRWGCVGGLPRPRVAGKVSGCIAKAIFHAPVDLEFPAEWPRNRANTWADLPAPGEKIKAGSPVLTCLAAAPTRLLCDGLILERVEVARGLLGLTGKIVD